MCARYKSLLLLLLLFIIIIIIISMRNNSIKVQVRFELIEMPKYWMEEAVSKGGGGGGRVTEVVNY